jgi:hypothetical protein
MRAMPIISLAASVALAAQVAVPSDPLESLVRDSPFLPGTGVVRSVASGENGPLELRSVVFEQGEFLFSVYDQGTRESKWVRLGQQDLPFVARSFNQEQDILTVDYQGRTLALELQPAHIADQPPAGSQPAPPPLPSAGETARQGGVRPSDSASSNPAPPPAALKPEESQRLQEMADEIRRRRQQSVQPSQN